MATRFYFASTGTPSVSPAINPGGEWEHANNARRPMRATPQLSTVSGGLYAPDAADHLVDGDSLVFHFVTDEQLAAQTISAQSLKWQFQMQESNANNNLFMAIKVYLVSADGSTIGDTILAIRRDGNELPTAFANRGDSATSASANANAGDRIVVEIGFGGTPTATTGVQGHNGNVRIGEDASSGDLPENDTETAATFRPWLEFANSLTFLPVSASTNKPLPLGGSAAATVRVSATSSKALPLGGSAAGGSGVFATSSKALPLGGSAAGTVTNPSTLADFVTDWPSIPAPFTQVTGGSGSISVSDNDLVLSKPATSDYAYLYLTEALPKDKDWLIYLPGVMYSATTMAYQVMLVTEAGGPTATTVANLLNKLAARISQGVVGSRVTLLDRWSNTGTRQEWNNAGSAWGAPALNSGHVWNAADRTSFFIQNDGANQRWRFGIVGGAQPHNDTTNPGQLLTTLTDWTDWSATLGLGANTYLVIGMPANDNSSGSINVGRGFKFSISDPADRTWVLNNAQNLISDGWVVRRAWGCGKHENGILFVPEDRSTIAIAKGSAGAFDEKVAKDKSWAYGPDGNLYCFWDGTTPTGASDYKIAVGIVTGGPGGTINKGTSTPIVPLGGVGEPAPDGTARAFFPYAFWDDDDAEWKLFCGTLSSFSSPTQWSITYYTNPNQDPRTGTWTFEGTILGPSGSGWRQNGLNGPIVFHHNGQWEVWVAGADGAASPVWTQGRFYGTNLLSLTEDPNNPRQNITPPAQQLTGAVTDSNVITVGSTTGYTPGAFVVIDDDSNVSNYVRARIRKILSSTQIELFNRITIGAGAWIFQSGTGSIQAQSIVRGGDGKWYFYTTPFALERGSAATTSAYAETSGVARLDDINSGQLVMVHDLVPAPSPLMSSIAGGQRSLENPALINPILTHTTSSGVSATSNKRLPLSGSAAAAVQVQASSSKGLPLGGSAAATVRVAASTSKALPLGGSASGVVGSSPITATSSKALPLGGTAAATVRVSGSTAKALPLGGSAAGVVGSLPRVATSIRPLPLAGIAAGTVGNAPIYTYTFLDKSRPLYTFADRSGALSDFVDGSQP